MTKAQYTFKSDCDSCGNTRELEADTLLKLPVPYTLTMKGNGSFVAEWNPPVKTPGLPEKVTADSNTSAIKAVKRLRFKLAEAGVLDELTKAKETPHETS